VIYLVVFYDLLISDNEISECTKKLADEFQDFNPTKLATQIESFKFLFASKLKSCNSVFYMTKLLIIENNNLITSFPDLLTAF